MSEAFYDLYLYLIGHNDELVKIPHLTRDDAENFAERWFEMNELHDYMLVVEGSTPWSEPAPIITEKTPEWIELEYAELMKR